VFDAGILSNIGEENRFFYNLNAKLSGKFGVDVFVLA
jgi:hypothetical protein